MSDITLLYVDDDRTLLKLTKDYIELQGDVSVDTASSVAEALKKLETGTFDAIISDYQMPGTDGLDFLKIVRARWRDMPFILFTGKGREEVIITALNLGADFFVQKGGNPRAQFAELMNMVYQAVLRRQSEIEVVRSERRLLDIINFLPDATVVIDRQGVVIAWNHAMEEMTGVPAQEMLGKGDYQYAIPFYGKRRELLVDLVMASDDELAAKDYRMVRREGNAVVAEIVNARPRGREVFLWAKANPLYDETGSVTGAIETIRDITDIRRAEEVLQDVNKKLGLMSSVTRHDIRNRIATLLSFAHLARASDDPVDMHASILQVIRAGKEIQRQIEVARDYEDLGVNSPSWQDITEVIGRVLDRHDPIAITIEYPQNHLECFADPLFDKVFDNLIDNALKYGGKVSHIAFSCVESGKDILLVCEDDGIGIPPDAKEKIFERGYGNDTGLGLFLVREILAITGMTIQENGVFTRGARFEILIPAGRFQHRNGVGRDNTHKHLIKYNALHSH